MVTMVLTRPGSRGAVLEQSTEFAVESMFQKLHQVIVRAFRPRQRQLRLAAGDEEVCLFAEGKDVWRFRWDEVVRIETYKRDIFSVDLVCLDFFIESREVPCRTHEDMQGFPDLRERMQCRFSSISEGWTQQVAFPPFATNQTVLYDRNAVS